MNVLFIEDDRMNRRVVRDMLDVAGAQMEEAESAEIGLERIEAEDFDMILVDLRMPGMDGLSCLSQIMIQAPRPVVMISSLTAEGADATLEAIELGAVDFIAKPAGTVSLEIDRLRPVLIEKIRGAVHAKIRPTLRLKERIRHQFRGAGVVPKPARLDRSEARRAATHAVPGLILVGTSTGGPAALDVVLSQLPKQLRWPVMVAQHMPANFTGAFARRLDRNCELEVVEVGRPMLLHPGTIYIGRGDADVVVSSRAAGMHAMPVPARRDYPWHPSVERMVRSALEHYDATRLIGVLMTGMGNDGAAAMTELRQRGGRTIAEAESTSVVWGMPGELVKNGGADLVRPVDEIAASLAEWLEADAVH